MGSLVLGLGSWVLGFQVLGGLELWDLGFGVWFWCLVISDSESQISKLDLRSATPYYRHPGATPKAKPKGGQRPKATIFVNLRYVRRQPASAATLVSKKIDL
jgi:hypothetical protein